MNWFFITGAYSGLFPKAPGTAGSVVALIIGIFILAFFDAQTIFLVAILTTIIAIKEIDKYEESTGIHDDKRVVIDEFAGMWFALSIAPAININLSEIFVLQNGFLVQSFLSFLLFRYFDITKPSIIGRIDKEAKGGIGVVLDDVIAGVAGGILSALIWQSYLKIIELWV